MNKRTRITEGWQPDESGREFAAARGVPDTEIGAFVDHHFGHGNLMASWPAAWRTWCRNAVRFGTATGKPTPPALILAFDAADPWGVRTWVNTIRDAKNETIQGRPIIAVAGWDIVATATEVCEAAGIDPAHRVDLEPIAQWLRDGIDPDVAIEAVRTSKRPDRPNLRYYDQRVRTYQRRPAA